MEFYLRCYEAFCALDPERVDQDKNVILPMEKIQMFPGLKVSDVQLIIVGHILVYSKEPLFDLVDECFFWLSSEQNNNSFNNNINSNI